MSNQINTRQQQMLRIIKEKQSVDVNELFNAFSVSSATVRKDLSVLEKAGHIIRKRGEAHIKQMNILTPFETRSNLNHEVKVAIARRAYELIQDGDTIILDSGTTTLEIARLLRDRDDITVLTNSLPIANLLSNSRLNVTLAGGQLFCRNMSTQGPETENYFSRVQVNKTFIAASGIQPEYGLAALSQIEAAVKQNMIRAARQVIAVFDSSKFNSAGVNLFTGFEDLDYFITDKLIQDKQLMDNMQKANLRFIIA